MRFADKTEERNFNRCTFARRGMWATTPDPTIDDRFLTGFVQLWNIAVYGYRSMIEFLPGKTLPALRDGIISFLPKTRPLIKQRPKANLSDLAHAEPSFRSAPLHGQPQCRQRSETQETERWEPGRAVLSHSFQNRCRHA